LEDALHPGPGLLGNGEYTGELPGRRDELGDIGGEREERAQRDLVVQRHPTTEGQDGDLTDRGNRL
jgi:hypothetical protein